MISQKFSIEDIHRIRNENYEQTKHMSSDELIENTKLQAEEGKRILRELKNKKGLMAN